MSVVVELMVVVLFLLLIYVYFVNAMFLTKYKRLERTKSDVHLSL